MNKNLTEKANAAEANGAGIIRNVEVAERCEAHGTYTATLVRPLDRFRGKYVALRDRLLRAGIVGVVDRLINGRKLLSEFMAIPTEVKWTAEFQNIVTTVGKNELLDKGLAGSGYTAAWYMGLISSTSYTTGVAVGDTMGSHGGWAEDTAYTEGARPTSAWSAAAAGSKALSSSLTFSINGSTTIKGCFMTTIATKGGTTGVLYSAGLFSGGDKVVSSGDTLSVSYTASL